MANPYFRGVPSEPAALMAKAHETVSAVTEGWRSLDRYLNHHALLTGGSGALMSAPVSLTSPIAHLLNASGCQTSSHAYRPTLDRGNFKLCLFDRSYVVAREFRFVTLAEDAVRQENR